MSVLRATPISEPGIVVIARNNPTFNAIGLGFCRQYATVLATATKNAAINAATGALIANNPKAMMSRGVLMMPPPIPTIEERVPTPIAKTISISASVNSTCKDAPLKSAETVSPT